MDGAPTHETTSPQLARARRPDLTDLLPQGYSLLKLLFYEAEDWCNRRALLLTFLEERRCQWEVNVDFDIPNNIQQIPLLAPVGTDRVLLPLLTFPKDLLPPAHVLTRDESGDWLSLEESRKGREIAYAILLAAAKNANLCMACAPPILWDLADSDTVTAHKAWRRLEECLHGLPHPTSTCWMTNGEFRHFVMISRLLYRSVLLVVNLSSSDVGRRKIVTITVDSPIRVTRSWREWLGLSPLVIAPRLVFGGNARSYHVQALPPERLTAVDSRVLYSYFSTCPAPFSGDLEMTGMDVLLDESKLVPQLKETGSHHWWGNIEGPADPMSSHVRASAERMPRLEDGRDTHGVFQLYPQYTGSLTQMLIAGVANFGFVLALVIGLQSHHLRELLAHAPEVIFILAALAVGFGVGLTLYPNEHLLTSSVLRPWRRLEAILLGFSIAVPITSVWQWHQVQHSKYLRLPMPSLWVEVGADAVVMLLLVVTCLSPRNAETSGRPTWRSTGLRFRRMSFPRHQVIDDREVARRELDSSTWSKWLQERKVREQQKMNEVKTRFADKYLVERQRQELFDRGIPPASRHARDQRSD